MTTAAAATVAPVPATAAADEQQDAATHIRTLEQLQEVTSCGLTAQAAQAHVGSVCVTDCGRRLGFWPPALCTFTGLASINLAGNSLTAIPHSVQALRSLRQLVVARNALTALPPELSCLTGLTELDVGGNQLRRLPDSLCALTGLQVLNAWGNELGQLPASFGQLTSLTRLGLKGCHLKQLGGSFCQLRNLVELFLTDNQLTALPAGFGRLTSLVKLQASYNRFEALPPDVWQLPRLELFRLAVGGLPQWPAGLLEAGGLPSLAWCSIGSNPAAAPVPDLPEHLPRVTMQQLSMGAKLGQGASGEVFVGTFNGGPVAVKIFVGGASPDGSTREELAITCQNDHPSLTKVLALVVGDAAADSGPAVSDEEDAVIGLVMGLVDGQPLADRPTSQHLLRCKWPATTYTSAQVAEMCHGLAGALAYLHARGVSHGDFYAHNILRVGSGHAVLCDFGAAFCYDREAAGGFWQAMEVRALGLFMQGLVEHVRDSSDGSASGSARRQQRLREVLAACLDARSADRPTFAQLEEQLSALL